MAHFVRPLPFYRGSLRTRGYRSRSSQQGKARKKTAPLFTFRTVISLLSVTYDVHLHIYDRQLLGCDARHTDRGQAPPTQFIYLMYHIKYEDYPT